METLFEELAQNSSGSDFRPLRMIRFVRAEAAVPKRLRPKVPEPTVAFLGRLSPCNFQKRDGVQLFPYSKIVI